LQYDIQIGFLMKISSHWVHYSLSSRVYNQYSALCRNGY